MNRLIEVGTKKETIIRGEIKSKEIYFKNCDVMVVGMPFEYNVILSNASGSHMASPLEKNRIYEIHKKVLNPIYGEFVIYGWFIFELNQEAEQDMLFKIELYNYEKRPL